MQEKTTCGLNDENEDAAFGKVDFAPLPDSSSYIHKLETRLSKVKGTGRDLTSKEMIKVMQSAREDFMSHLLSGSSNQREFSDEDVDREVSSSYLEKKLFPEKIGVTVEEIQRLLECDVLAKTVMEKNCDSSSDSSVDR